MDLKYNFSIFLRRLHYFLLIAVGISTVAVTVAVTLPPAYVSQTRLIMEAPQIPSELAASTVTTPPLEQLQIIEQRLMTRATLLDIARRHNVLDDIERMNADQIVRAMRARTDIRNASSRDAATLMTISFEAANPRTAAEVLNAYLTLIEQQNVEFRTTRSGQTLEFFEQEAARLSSELDAQSARILEFKNRNAGALPDSLDYRLSQQSALQERVAQINRDISSLRSQSERLVQMFETTGQIDTTQQTLSPQQQQLQQMHQELDEVLLVYSAENPRVRMLQARIAQLEERLNSQPAAQPDAPARNTSVLDIQLAEIDTRIELLEEQRAEAEARLGQLEETIALTPANTIALEDLERSYRNIEGQYNRAVERLSQASTGDRIESLSRGQRISVIDPPAVPTEPTKPNRILIAGGGTTLGILGGLGLVMLLEFLNRTARRPEDIVARLGITPLSTLPYIRSGYEVFWKRVLKFTVFFVIIVGIPAAVYAIHMYYLPLDLLADRLMDRLGIRW